MLEYQLRLFFEILDIETSIEFIRDGAIINESSLRGIENKQERVHERVFRLCKYFESQNYINTIGGLDIYDKELFAKEGLRISFIEMKDRSESLNMDNFKPFLSIIDVLMNLGVLKTKKLLNEFNLH